MRFILTGRAFIIPALSGLLLLGQYWIPEIKFAAVILNGIALLLLMVDYFLMPDPKHFTLKRTVPDLLFLHQDSQITLEISYISEIPLTLSVCDTIPDTCRSDMTTTTRSLLRGEGSFQVSYTLCPLKRGVVTFTRVGIRAASPIGFLYRQFQIADTVECKVYPRLITEGEELRSLFYTAQFESRLEKRYDAGREFSQVREYRIGDDMRTVHWKKSARTGKLVVKEYEPEKGQNVFLCIDGGRLMMAESEGKSKVDLAVSASLALTREALKKQDSVGIALFNEEICTWLRPSNKKSQLSAVTHAVYDFQPRFIEPEYESIFMQINFQLKQRSMIIIYTDFADPYISETLGRLIKVLARRHRIICCTISVGDLKKLAYTDASTLKDAVTGSVLRESLDNRQTVLNDLRKHGVEILDVEPKDLSNAVLNSYIRARWR